MPIIYMTQKGMLLTELNNIDLRKDIFIIQYDDFGRKNQTTSPDTGATKYQYDPAEYIEGSGRNMRQDVERQGGRKCQGR